MAQNKHHPTFWQLSIDHDTFDKVMDMLKSKSIQDKLSELGFDWETKINEKWKLKDELHATLLYIGFKPKNNKNDDLYQEKLTKSLKYFDLMGDKVEIKIIGIYWDEKICALHLELGDVPCDNEYPHFTLMLGFTKRKNKMVYTRPVHSNEMLKNHFENKNNNCLVFDESFVVTGTVEPIYPKKKVDNIRTA